MMKPAPIEFSCILGIQYILGKVFSFCVIQKTNYSVQSVPSAVISSKCLPALRPVYFPPPPPPPSTPIPLKITSLTHAVVSTSIRCRMIAYNVVSMQKRRHVPPGEGLSQNHRFVTDGKSIRSSYIKIVIQHLVSKYWLDLLGTNRHFSYQFLSLLYLVYLTLQDQMLVMTERWDTRQIFNLFGSLKLLSREYVLQTF